MKPKERLLCAVPGCPRLDESPIFCRTHWRQVPMPVRLRIFDAWLAADVAKMRAALGPVVEMIIKNGGRQ